MPATSMIRTDRARTPTTPMRSLFFGGRPCLIAAMSSRSSVRLGRRGIPASTMSSSAGCPKPSCTSGSVGAGRPSEPAALRSDVEGESRSIEPLSSSIISAPGARGFAGGGGGGAERVRAAAAASTSGGGGIPIVVGRLGASFGAAPSGTAPRDEPGLGGAPPLATGTYAEPPSCVLSGPGDG